MNELDAYVARSPVLAVMAAAIDADLQDVFGDISEAVTITTGVMDRAAMAAALSLPYNRDVHDVQDQITVEVFAPGINSAMLLTRIINNYRVIEKTKRPTLRGEAQRTALVCLVPTHLGPRNWFSTRDVPASFTLQVAGA